MSDNRARIGFIGAGWWATSNHMPVFVERDDVDLVGVCRLGKDELIHVQEAFGFSYATEDYRQLLSDVEMDGVVIASPHTSHYEHAKAALEQGLHVMCEKPMCTDGSQAMELVQLAKDRNLHLLVPYGWHYKKFVLEAKALLDGGIIGDIQYVMTHMASPIRQLLTGVAYTGESGGTEAFFEPEAATWADPKVAGGGYGHSQLSHAIGMLFWLTDLYPVEVNGIMTAPDSKVELYDALTVRFENGIIGTVSGAGTVPADKGFQLDHRIFGSEGLMTLDFDRARLDVQKHDGGHYSMDLKGDEGAYTCEGPPNNFVDLITGNTTENFAPGWAAARSVQVLDAAYRSALSGKTERV